MKSKYILTIAGSDIYSGGGMQADMMTFTQHGLFGFVALTCLTSVDEQGFHITPVAPELLKAELASLDDVPFSAIKIGLLPTVEIAQIVLEFIKRHSDIPLVLDPVLVFKENGDETISQMKEQLLKFLPFAQVTTPNLLEAELLTGIKINTETDLVLAAEKLYQFGVKQAVVKGGSRLNEKDAVDAYVDENGAELLRLPIIEGNNNGAGCTFASAIASQIALDNTGVTAVQTAKFFVHDAIELANDYGVVPHLKK